jgi:hypothetical protein
VNESRKNTKLMNKILQKNVKQSIAPMHEQLAYQVFVNVLFHFLYK